MISTDERTVGTSRRRNFASGIPPLHVSDDRGFPGSIRRFCSCASPLPQTRCDPANRAQSAPQTMDRARGCVPPGALRFGNCRSHIKGTQTDDAFHPISSQGTQPRGGTNTRSYLGGSRRKQALANVGPEPRRSNRQNAQQVGPRVRGKGQNHGPRSPQFRAVECVGNRGAERLYSRSGPVGSFVSRSTNAAWLAQGPRNGSAHVSKKVPTYCSYE